ncbi:MAG: hypothetical protein JWQ87_1802 [Candidatus Sulfotelmatobacter sp.]|nr:hypothetical protein [Candidatus Sulfotelmatobacter sp.]
MAQPVWTLSVDLQTKTATFTSGLNDAAKGARGSFNEIKEGAREMGSATSYSMMEARHGVMLLGEEFGIHIPRALTAFITSLGPVGAAMQVAFPFLAIIVGATLLLEHLSKLKEKGDKLTESQLVFGTTVTNVLNGLDQKLLEAGIKSDELNQNHLAALNKQLELIDRQSMNDLVQAFGVVAKAADATFTQLKTSWYQLGAGSAGAKNALDEFKNKYDSLLAQGKDKEANDLLSGTRKSAEHVLELQKQIKENQTTTGTHGTHTGDYNKFEQASNELKKLGIGYTDKEVESQQMLVDAYRAQATVQEKVNALKASQSSNAVQSTDNKLGGEADKVARERAASQRKEMEEAQKLWEENYREAVSALQETERQKIEDTDSGSRERLASIDAAIKEENAKGLQQTGFYKSLLRSRIQTAKEMDAEENKLQAEAGKESAGHDLKMGELRIAAEREHSQLRSVLALSTGRERLQTALQLANEEFQQQQEANQKQIAALNQHDKEFENKKKALENKEEELERAHQNRLQQITDQASQQQYSKLTATQQKIAGEWARGFSQVLMGHMSFAKMSAQIGDQVLSSMMQNALMSIITLDMTKEREAAAAARKGFLWGWEHGGPAAPILAPSLGAMAFAAEMAFQDGGIVPGVGRGDTVPALLEPGEGVLNRKQMDRLNYNAKFGNGSGGGDTHVHHHHSYQINAIDGASVKGMLDKHSDTFERHFHSTLRKMNK